MLAQACQSENALKVSKLGGTVAPMFTAPGDTLNYKLNLTNFGPSATGAQFTVTASGGGWTRPIRQATTTLSTDFKLINTTAWTTSTFKLYAWGTRGATISRDSTLIATWTVNRSVGPPPSGDIDSSGVISLRQYLNPEQLQTIQPVLVTLYTSDSLVSCNGEWVGAANRSLRILPTLTTKASCLPLIRHMPLNVDALKYDSLAKADTSDSIYVWQPPLPWYSSTALLDTVDGNPSTLRYGPWPKNVTLAVGQKFQLCWEELYSDETKYSSCTRMRNI